MQTLLLQTSDYVQARPKAQPRRGRPAREGPSSWLDVLSSCRIAGVRRHSLAGAQQKKAGARKGKAAVKGELAPPAADSVAAPQPDPVLPCPVPSYYCSSIFLTGLTACQTVLTRSDTLSDRSDTV